MRIAHIIEMYVKLHFISRLVARIRKMISYMTTNKSAGIIVRWNAIGLPFTNAPRRLCFLFSYAGVTKNEIYPENIQHSINFYVFFSKNKLFWVSLSENISLINLS